MIKSLEELYIPSIVKLHRESLKGDFLPSLGDKVLSEIYKGAIGSPTCISFVYLEDNKVVGFVLGTTDMKSFFKQICRKRLFQIILLVALEFLKKPYIIKKLLETVNYTDKETGAKAELVVITINKNHRGQNLGRKLVESLEENLQKLKIKRYKVTVHADKEANNFYQHLQFVKRNSFRLYNKEWFVYEKKIKAKN